MNEPKRWLEDPAAGHALKELLGDCKQASPIPAAALASLQLRLSQALSSDVDASSPDADTSSAQDVMPDDMVDAAEPRSGAAASNTTAAAASNTTAAAGTLSAGGMAVTGGAVGLVIKVAGAALVAGALAMGAMRLTRTNERLAEGSAIAPAENVAQSHSEPLAIEPLAIDDEAGRARGSRVAPPDGPPSSSRRPVGSQRAKEQQAPTPEQLEAEAALLEQVRRALARDPDAAMRLLGDFHTRFPSPALAFERDLLRIETLARSGRHDRFLSEARALLRAHPNSVYRKRVETLIARFGESDENRAPSMKDQAPAGNQ